MNKTIVSINWKLFFIGQSVRDNSEFDVENNAESTGIILVLLFFTAQAIIEETILSPK